MKAPSSLIYEPKTFLLLDNPSLETEMAKNSLANLNAALPSTKVDLDAMAKRYQSTSFLKRVQLVSSGDLVNKGLAKPGEWVIPIDGDTVENLGDSIDGLVISVRDKALDTNPNPPVAAFDVESDLYKEIVEQAGTKDSGCMYGPSFLLYVREAEQFLELFLGNASGRQEAKKLFPFLPISEDQAKAYGKQFKAQGPQAVTLTSKYVSRGRFKWYAPVASKCSTPFNDLPDQEEFIRQATKFVNPEESNSEVAEDGGRD